MINIGTEVICESENGKQLMVCACTNIDEKGSVCEFYSNESGEWELIAMSSVTEDEFIGYMKQNCVLSMTLNCSLLNAAMYIHNCPKPV